MFKRNQRGITLIEMVLVLGMAVIITVFALKSYEDYTDKSNAKDFYLDIVNMTVFIEDLYTNGSDLEGINSAALHQLGFKTHGFRFDSTLGEYKHSYTPQGFSGGNIGEIHVSTMSYRMTAAYQIRISGVKSGYVCSEVARKIKKFGTFTEIQIAGTQLIMGAANTITDKMIDETCRSQQIISLVFIKDNYI